MILDSGNIILIGSLLLFVSVFASKAGYRFGVPALLLFLGVGMLFGSDGIGIQFNSPSSAQFIGMMALTIILFSGGMDTHYSEIKPIAAEGIVLATLGVIFTALLTGIFIFVVTGFFDVLPTLTLLESLLLASVVSSTDSASVFSLLRSKRQGLKQRLRPLLELESGSNDPVAYMLTILLIAFITQGGEEMSLANAGIMFLVQMSVGAGAGFLLGKLVTVIINRINVENRSLYSVLLLAGAFFIFSFTELIKGNGYLAVYIAGLVIGNHKLVHKKSLTTFFDGFAWLFQIVMFLTLGLLVNPSELVDVVGIGMVVGFFMLLFARPMAVFLCLAPFRKLTFKARVFVSWVGLRGAVPIIFATYPLIAEVPHASLIFNIVFFLTIISLIVQGTTINWFAKLLGLAVDLEDEDTPIDLPEKMISALSEIDVTPALLERGEFLSDLMLPDHTLVVMVRRENRYFVPKGATRLQLGDQLLVIPENNAEMPPGNGRHVRA